MILTSASCETVGPLRIVSASETIIEAVLEGQIHLGNLQSIWEQLTHLQHRYQPKQMIVFCEKLTDCDSALLSLFLNLEQEQKRANHDFALKGLPPRWQSLLAYFRQFKRPQTPTLRPLEPINPISQLGKAIYGWWQAVGYGVQFFGELCCQLFNAVRQPKRIPWQAVITVCETVGPNAVFIIILVGFLMGLILAFQAAMQLRIFGADIYVANLVGVSLTRELGPLMTAIILIGRSGSAFAAALGTMKINQEIDALTSMNLNPMEFLVLPRVLAAMLMMPFLNILLLIFGILGGAVVMHTLGFSIALYLQQLKTAVWLRDFWGGMFKAFIFGILAAYVGCLQGMRTGHGAMAVGESTTRAVVNGIILLAIFDGIFSILYYVMGI